MSVSTPNVWELRADPDRIRASARAWHALGDAVRMAHSVVESETRALLGTGWTGHAADTYHEHRDRMARDGADVTDAATEVGKALDRIADLLETADGYLSDSLRDITTRLAHEQVRVDKVGNDLVFQTVLPRHDEAVMAELSYAHQIRSRLDEVLVTELRTIQAQQPVLENVSDRRERAEARANLHIIPPSGAADRGPAFVRDVNACLDTMDRPGGDPEGIMPTIYDRHQRILIRESPYELKSVASWDTRDSDPQVEVKIKWKPDPDMPAKNGIDCGVLYHELYHAYEAFQDTFDYRECGDTGIPIAEVKASFAEDAYLRAALGPSWEVDDEGNWVERRHKGAYDDKPLPSSIDVCYEDSHANGNGGARNASGDGGAEGAGGVGGSRGSG